MTLAMTPTRFVHGRSFWIMPFALSLTIARAPACESVSSHAHEIVAAQAIEVMPEPLGAYLRGHADRLRLLVRELPALAVAHDTMRGDTHFVLLDLAARDGSPSARHRAAEAFPRDAGEAARHCKTLGRSECGRLPWGIIETYAALVVAFREHDEERIVAETAALLHLATDAAMPFDTTVEREAGRTEEDRSPPDGFRSAAARVQTVVIERAHERFAFEVRVWPGRFTPLADPTAAVFDALADAYRDADELIVLDREAIARVDPSSALSREQSYVQAFSERGMAIIEQRLAAGALLGAELAHAAWTSAGSPKLASTASQSLFGKSPPNDAIANGCGQPFCGSRDSTVFHTSTCAHVGRIHAENMIGFASAAAAHRSGRKACRSCKPNTTDSDRP